MNLKTVLTATRSMPLWGKIVAWVFAGLYLLSPLDGVIPVIDDLILLLITMYFTFSPKRSQGSSPTGRRSGNSHESSDAKERFTKKGKVSGRSDVIEGEVID